MSFTPRAAWSETPEPVRAAVAEALGSAIVGHRDLHGGMSPGPAAGLRLADGRRVFVKAVSAEVRAHNHKMIRQESEVLDTLPPTVPAPRRLATVESGPWIALITTWAAGATGALWTDASIAAVAQACRKASAHRAPATLPQVAQRIFDFDGWSRVLESGIGDDWEATHAAPAAEVVSGWENWTAGDALVHRDIRLDNTTFDAAGGSVGGSAGEVAGDAAGGLAGRSAGGSAGGSAGELAGGSAGELAGGSAGELAGGSAGDTARDQAGDSVGDQAGGSAVLLDWAYAAAGAPWIDLAQLAADVVATGHVLGPETATDRAYEMLRTLPPEASRFVVGLAGMWCIRAATVPDTVMPEISTWRRARSAALRPLIIRLIAGETSAAGEQRQRLVD